MPDPPLGFYPLKLFPLIAVVVSLDTPCPLDVTTLYQVTLVKLFPVSFDIMGINIDFKEIAIEISPKPEVMSVPEGPSTISRSYMELNPKIPFCV
jgi:hypothetical protein